MFLEILPVVSKSWWIAWTRSRDKNLLSGSNLTISRISLLWVILLDLYANMFNSVAHSLDIRINFCIVWTLSNHFSTWLATSLRLFYLLKVANFSSFLFLYLKWGVKCVVVMILLGTLVFLVVQLAVTIIDEHKWTNNYKGNITWQNDWKAIFYLSNMTFFTLQNILLFTMYLTSHTINL